MKRLIKFILAVSILSSFWACDKIETPYKDGVETTTPEVTDRTKRILLEDYTGHTCGTCPPAAQTASSLLSTFGDKVVMMGVHAGWFAKPKTGDQYTTDFRTEQSEAFYEYFQINTNPIGLINRLEFNGSRQVTHTSWEEKILAIQDEEADLSMEIESSYDENSNEVSININTTFFNDLPEDYNLIVSFIEDSVIDWQKWYGNTPEDVENYVHRHVLRDNINDLWGDPIDPTLTTTGTEHTFQYSYAPNTDWNLKKSYIVAYVYNTSTNEVLQVAEAHADEH